MNKNFNINKLKFFLIVSTLLSSLTCSNSNAEVGNNNFAIGAKIGSGGLGLDGRAMITNGLYGRLGVNYFKYNAKLNIEGDKLVSKLKINFLTVPIMLDYHPFNESGFRLSVGIAYNDNNISTNGTPTESVKIDNVTYSTA